MKRRDPEPGMPAKYVADCPRCPDRIKVGDRVVYSRGRPIHVTCASGSDDE